MTSTATASSELVIRDGGLDDLPGLVALEDDCFSGDRISRRQFRYLLTKANSSVLIGESAGQLAGYAITLFSRGTSLARLYSIAVKPSHKGRGFGKALVKAAENVAWKHRRAFLRLEIRKDNTPSIRLFESLGYRRIGERPDYYEDHADAWRYERNLRPDAQPRLSDTPYYEQTLEFTCGPAALMMALKKLRPQIHIDRKLELRLWREATTIFMTAGHGGCGPLGLALAAARRQVRAEVFLSDRGVLFIDSVRNEDKKEVLRLVQEDMTEQAKALGIVIHYRVLSLPEMAQALERGAVALVLISSWLIYQEKFPHWITVTGLDDHFVYAHDPFVDYKEGETRMDSIHMPIPRNQFEQMTRYGKARLQAVVLLHPD